MRQEKVTPPTAHLLWRDDFSRKLLQINNSAPPSSGGESNLSARRQEKQSILHRSTSEKAVVCVDDLTKDSFRASAYGCGRDAPSFSTVPLLLQQLINLKYHFRRGSNQYKHRRPLNQLLHERILSEYAAASYRSRLVLEGCSVRISAGWYPQRHFTVFLGLS
jgi:hypothetical protein